MTFVIDGIEKKQFVEANPHFKTINVYDGSMQRISNREFKDKKQSESEGKSTAKNAKQELDDSPESPHTKESVKNRKKKANSI